MGPPKRGRDLGCVRERVKATGGRPRAIGAGMAREVHAGAEFAKALNRLRALCAEWPGVAETTGWGNPTFEANGQAFAVLDRYQGSYCIWVRCGSARREALLKLQGYFPAPYDRKKQAVCRKLEWMDWKRFGKVLRESYEGAMTG